MRPTDVTFVGRLATYRYYNMDQIVGQALATFRRIDEARKAKAKATALAAAPVIVTGVGSPRRLTDAAEADAPPPHAPLTKLFRAATLEHHDCLRCPALR